ncbi:MAG: hypothetical protein QW632_00230 [Ignisphaera sp.]
MSNTKLLAITFIAVIQVVLLLLYASSAYAEAAGVAVLFPPPTPVKGVKTADPSNRWTSVDLDNAQFMANLWNLATGAQGSMIMNFTGSYVEVFGNFTNLPKSVTVQGGPGIRYGQGIWGGLPPAHPLYNIPKKVTALPYAIFFANYTIYEKESTLPLTAALYLWTVEALRSSGTQAGDVLVIVRVYRHPGAPLTGTPQAQANVTAPLIVNNTLVYGNFEVFVGNLDRSANTHTTVVFELTAPIRSGRVGIPVQDYIALAANILESLAPKVWSRAMVLNNTLQMIDFTIEWYSNQQGGGVFKWRLYEVSFLVGAKPILTTVTLTKTATSTLTTTSTIVSTVVNTVPTTVVSTVTSSIPTTVTSIVTTPTTVLVPVTTTATTTVRSVATVTSTTTVVSTSTSPITQTVTNWSTAIALGIVLLIIGFVIGWVVKRK